jgi:hypothetical protein
MSEGCHSGKSMTPELKPAAIEDRTVVAVEDQGVIIDLGNTKVLLDSFFDRGIKHLLLTPGEPVGTHWWLLRMKSGIRLRGWTGAAVRVWTKRESGMERR